MDSLALRSSLPLSFLFPFFGGYTNTESSWYTTNFMTTDSHYIPMDISFFSLSILFYSLFFIWYQHWPVRVKERVELFASTHAHIHARLYYSHNLFQYFILERMEVLELQHLKPLHFAISVQSYFFPYVQRKWIRWTHIGLFYNIYLT